jgi:hypothetical protein
MSLLHHSYLLYKVNQVYKEVKKRHAAKKEVREATENQEEEVAQTLKLETPDEAKPIANSIFKQVCFYINRNASNLES